MSDPIQDNRRNRITVTNRYANTGTGITAACPNCEALATFQVHSSNDDEDFIGGARRFAPRPQLRLSDADCRECGSRLVATPMFSATPDAVDFDIIVRGVSEQLNPTDESPPNFPDFDFYDREDFE